MKMIRLFLLGILSICWVSSAPAAPTISPELEKVFTNLQSNDRRSVEDAASYVVQHADTVPSFLLLLASAKAIALNDFENAGFLFYSGQIRAQFDLQRFPPTVKGGDSPTTALGTLKKQIGEVVNPRVFRQPQVYSRIIHRLEQWMIATKADYNPGWEYHDQSVGGNDLQSWEKETFNKIKSEHLVFARGFSKLLNMPEYFAAFKTVQDYDMASKSFRDVPANKRAMQDAENIMKHIEKKRKINGMYFKKGNASSID